MCQDQDQVPVQDPGSGSLAFKFMLVQGLLPPPVQPEKLITHPGSVAAIWTHSSDLLTPSAQLVEFQTAHVAHIHDRDL